MLMDCTAVTTVAADAAKAADEASPDRLAGAGVRFERIRRITGYLVGTLDRFNDAKRAEEQDRVKHAL